ncbi:hypothetical protein ACSBR1_029509 [Camellia fascicularis]
MENLYSVDEGIVKIKDALCCKRVLVIVDDVDTMDQLDAVLGMRDWFLKVHKVENLNYNESLELFSWHAFGKNYPIDGFIEDSKRVVQYCGGLPIAIKILGSSLFGKSLNVWKSQLEKLKAIPDNEVVEKLKISYDSLQDDHDKKLFLHVACFFVGMDEDWVVTILDGCDFFTTVGIQNLIDRCMLTIDESKKLVMHQLVQEMGKEIVRRESPKEPGERSRLWNHKDFFNVLREILSDDFPLDNLVVLDMQYSNLQKVWERTKRLVLLNLKDCKNLRELPRSIVMLKFLETLDISGCSNINELPTKIGSMNSLTKFNANGIAIIQLLSTTKEVKPWYSFIWPSLSKPRKSVEISCALLARFLVHLSLVNCNLSEDAFPKDLSNLSSLQILNLSNNPIRSLPNCIKGLIGLQLLELGKCKRLQSLIVEQNVKVLMFSGCTLLEIVTFRSVPSTIELNNVHDEYIMGNKLVELYSSKCS